MALKLSPMTLESKSIVGGVIPDRHSKDGGNVSPHLRWRDLPEGTRALALICHDPDAPFIAEGQYGFVHWVLYNIPPDAELEEGSSVGVPGFNSYGETAYGGPKPPPGHGPHHYFFVLFALKRTPDLPIGLNAWQLLDRIEPDVIGINRLMGRYESPN